MMQLYCDESVAHELKSSSQKVRRISEVWFIREAYCLRCDNMRLSGTAGSTPFMDAVCPICGLGYELKSKAKSFSAIVPDGGYEAMLRNIVADNAPVLMLLNYQIGWRVDSLIAIHPAFLTPEMVVRRKRPHIRPKSGRPYWMCNLDLSQIPNNARIPIVKRGAVQNPLQVRSTFSELSTFESLPFSRRGWAGATLGLVQKLGIRNFRTSDIYSHADDLHKLYPNNHHVEAKIRQQLQILVKLGFLERTFRGNYHVVSFDTSHNGAA